MLYLLIGILLIGGSLSVLGQTAADSSITIVKELEDVEVVQNRSVSFVEQYPERLVVDMEHIQYMPKFLGTSDPLRYLQSLPAIQTNNETSTGVHIHGCDDHQTLVSINGAPVYYPNHLMGLYSTFIGSHFRTMTLETTEHTGTMDNRIGGWVDFGTPDAQPKRFGLEGNIGIINSDLTLTIPMGRRNALWLSARSSYINWLYGKLLKLEEYALRYHFMDFNLTYLSQLTDHDQLLVTGFYSRDKMRVYSNNSPIDIRFPWQNIVGSVTWKHHLPNGLWTTNAYYSSFDNQLDAEVEAAQVKTDERFASAGVKNNLTYHLTEQMTLTACLDYVHYINQPLSFALTGIAMFGDQKTTYSTAHGDELSLGADLRHEVCPWFAYNAGLHLSGFANKGKLFGGIDPRVSLHFTPATDHTLSVHYGMYHQYFHKSGLTGGGLPTDFFYLASEKFKPERAHAVSLKYLTSFYHRQYSVSAELYFKQIYDITESTGNVLQVLNKRFSFDDYIVTGNGRNYGMNIMFQRNTGIITGYVSYTLGWARRSLPGLEGFTDYRYAASSERVHDLKVVFNSRFAKRWNISAMFVLATGLPFTEAEEAYMLNGKLICRYSSFNEAHLPLYHRLDLSCSCDIIKTPEHVFGINLSLYNTYAQKNVQFVVYRETLQPIYGTSLSTIIPSISLYGTF